MIIIGIILDLLTINSQNANKFNTDLQFSIFNTQHFSTIQITNVLQDGKVEYSTIRKVWQRTIQYSIVRKYGLGQ